MSSDNKVFYYLFAVMNQNQKIRLCSVVCFYNSVELTVAFTLSEKFAAPSPYPCPAIIAKRSIDFIDSTTMIPQFARVG